MKTSIACSEIKFNNCAPVAQKLENEHLRGRKWEQRTRIRELEASGTSSRKVKDVGARSYEVSCGPKADI